MKAPITLDADFRIESDENYYILIQKVLEESRTKGKPNGKMIEKEKKTYHAKLNLALKRYLRESLKECESIKGVISKLEEIESKIEQI